MKIDAHAHVWTAALGEPGRGGRAVISPADTLERLRPLALASGMDAVVLVQTVGDERETEALLALTADCGRGAGSARGDRGVRGTRCARGDRNADVISDGFVAGVVGWVDLSSPNAGARLDHLRAAPGGDRLVGVRTMVPETGEGLAASDLVRGMLAVAERALALDLLLTPRRLPDALALADAVPGLRLIVDHLAKPEVAVPSFGADVAGGFTAWRDGMRALARRPNVAVKLSGLLTQLDAGQGVAELQPYVDVVLGAFGPERTMLGSDWPLCEAAGAYGRVTGDLVELVRVSDAVAGPRTFAAGERLSDAVCAGRSASGACGDALPRVHGGTACNWYRLWASGPAQAGAIDEQGRPVTDESGYDTDEAGCDTDETVRRLDETRRDSDGTGRDACP